MLPSYNIDVLKCNIEEYLDPRPYLAYRFEAKITELKNMCKITREEEICIRERCKKFLLCLFKQLKQRLPENIEILRTVSILSVRNVLRPVKNNEALTKLMKYFGVAGDVIALAQYQFQKIHLIDWTNNADTDAFWNEVHQYRDSSAPANNAMQGPCGNCKGCPYGNRTDLAAGAAVAPYGLTARVLCGSNYLCKLFLFLNN